ncbi:hypothetical protein M2323_000469 [Rhodoblastus acidophilus]|uniref:Hint domain-containing protein n=1 Tax=Rhodoblastus acidophilus TaxID=1074 RepID=UPI0022243DEA|nr:Hint domain-containing protein [Rhodoblastus acidophilus]MCW2282708.1 hypothetical protein [Rhodoblastus acidophilus]MCW2331569.1 hypothetical protein [Rhodoblastus acidophilus]
MSKLVVMGGDYLNGDCFVETFDPSTGVATPVARFSIDPDVFWSGLPFAADANDCYIVSALGLLYDINLATGAVTTKGGGHNIDCMTLNGSSLVAMGYEADFMYLYLETIDRATGEAADNRYLIASDGFNVNRASVAASATDIYVVSSGNVLYGCSLTEARSWNTPLNAQVLRLTYNGSQLFALCQGAAADQYRVETVDPNTGTMSLVATFSFSAPTDYVTSFCADATDAYVMSNGNPVYDYPALLYDINLSTGTVSVADLGKNVGAVTTEVACFARGTSLMTDKGEVAVENLARGDLLLTSEGAFKPVAWIGRSTISTRFSDPLRVCPIRIKAGALSEGVPSRDLLLSPDHALFVDGLLVHASALVNGASIVRERAIAERIVYYHVELEAHELVLAENAPVETFVDTAERLTFDNWEERQALYPTSKPIEELSFARVKARRQLPARLRQALEARAAALTLPDANAA